MKRLRLTLLCTLFALPAVAQKPLTYEDIASGALNARSVGGLRPMNDGEHYTTQQDHAILRWRYADGEVVDTLFNSPAAGFRFGSYAFSEDESKILLTTEREAIYRHSSRAENWIYDRADGSLSRLSENGKQQEATLSPDGRKAAFVRNNDLWMVDLVTGTERRITSDGAPGKIINGIPDWVYEEEYSFSRAYEWSPASDAIAFYRFDESRVKEYSMNTFEGKLYPVNYDFKYPKAGEENAVVQIKVYRLQDGSLTDIDLGGNTDIYIPRIEWAEELLVVHRLNRLQNHYELLIAEPRQGGATRVLYSETDPRYIDRVDNHTVTFLPKGAGFVIQSEADGWKHLYRYDMQGQLVNQITRGEWEVTALYGIDAEAGKVYYQSTQRWALGRDVWEIGLDGTGIRRLSNLPGTNSAVFSKGFRYYINYFSDVDTPTQVTLCRIDGSPVRTLEENRALMEKIGTDFVLPHHEFFSFITSEGVELNGYVLLPADFDPSRQYPVLMTQYSGPGSQRVADKWGWSWEAALPAEGIVVACVDGRGTGFRGAEFRKCTYGNLGGLETADQIEAAKYLASLPFVDAERIAIYGWSYGGFMALNCILKGNDVFSMAIAVAPVTSWRYYDTIYTELYNGLPQENPAGYDDNSPINYADRLRGKLLLAHGTGDDNVHIQNSYEMIEELVKADKEFEMLIYPDKNHGMGSARNHLMKRIIGFVKSDL